MRRFIFNMPNPIATLARVDGPWLSVQAPSDRHPSATGRPIPRGQCRSPDAATRASRCPGRAVPKPRLDLVPRQCVTPPHLFALRAEPPVPVRPRPAIFSRRSVPAPSAKASRRQQLWARWGLRTVALRVGSGERATHELVASHRRLVANHAASLVVTLVLLDSLSPFLSGPLLFSFFHFLFRQLIL